MGSAVLSIVSFTFAILTVLNQISTGNTVADIISVALLMLVGLSFAKDADKQILVNVTVVSKNDENNQE